ncbi:E3 ubiquitin-protein ligase CSU1 [Paramyrothecium foliicola]|nr:E3 ubiquitin-protein ligase CSU1 [Paramyrothecium foliicola]
MARPRAGHSFSRNRYPTQHSHLSSNLLNPLSGKSFGPAFTRRCGLRAQHRLPLPRSPLRYLGPSRCGTAFENAVMSHSKRNTSRPVFTAHERALAKSSWSASSARLNRDSFLPFGSCGLCLEIAREPVACHRGDIFCRECALANLLAQKKELKRADKVRQATQLELDKIRALEDEEEKERAIRDFELTQAGLAPSAKAKAKAVASASASAVETTDIVKAGTKRKFSLDESELSRIAQEDRAKARKAIEDEKAAKPSLPSFWTPSLTPDIQDSKLPALTKKGKLVPTCPASADDNPHTLSMQKLVTLQFDEVEEEGSRTKRKTCPSCRKALNNASNAVMARACGHVLCRACVKLFLTPSSKKSSDAEAEPALACFVCEIPLGSSAPSGESSKDALPSGLVALKSEGTGFSAKGGNTIEKSGVAFQC